MPEAEGDLNETLDRLLGLVSRRRWWLLTTASSAALTTVFVLSLVPNRYSSEATLLVVQQQVPERYVLPTTTSDVNEALQAMTQAVLSRTQLLGIIDEFGLYAKAKKRLASEEILELMRRDVEITPLASSPQQRNISAFKISFRTDSPHLAQQVTSRLTSLFISENLKTREDQATNTTKFLQEQLESARTKLAEQEERVRDYKTRYLGELPEQQQGNLAVLAGMQTQLQNTTASLDRAQQQRVYLESLLTGYRSLAARGAPVVSGVSRVASPIELVQASLVRLVSERAKLLVTYTPRHPDVTQMDVEIARTEALLQRLKASEPPATEEAKVQTLPAASRGTEEDSAIAQLKSQLEANRVELENLSKDQKQLRAAIAQYHDRLSQTPVREQQLAAILRDHDLLKQDYSDLVRKQLQAELATSLERQQAGQQFRLVDPPSLPTVPVSPKRVTISLGGAAGGILLGLVLAFLADGRDRSFHSEKNVSQRFALPLVVGIPLLLTPTEKRVRAWKGALEWFAGSVLVLAVFVAEFYVYRHG